MSTVLAKWSCSHCDGHLEFDPAYAGERIACPHCGKETVLGIPLTDGPPPIPSPAPPPTNSAAPAAYRLADETGPRTPALQPTATAARSTKPFARQAARASWMSFIASCLFGSYGALIYSLKRSPLGEILLIMGLLLPLLGVALGLIAMFGTRKHGMKGILRPAVTGLVLNGLLIGWMVVPATLAGLRRAHAFQERKRHLAATQATAPAVTQDALVESSPLRAALVGKWVMDREGTADAIARSRFRERRQVTRLPAKAGQPQAYRTNIVSKPFNANEYESAKAEALRGAHVVLNLQWPYLTFAADGTGRFDNPNITDDPARRRTGFRWRLDGHNVTMSDPGGAHTNEFQFTNQTRISIPFLPEYERGLFIVYTREGAKSK